MANYLSKARHASSMAGAGKETAMSVRGEAEEEIKALLKGTDVAWMQYKRDHGTRHGDTNEQFIRRDVEWGLDGDD
jgi:hypothetical protein